MSTPDALPPACALTEDLVSATVARTGYPPSHVRLLVEACVAYLLREYGGTRLPRPARLYPRAEILAAKAAGVPQAEICRKFAIGKSTLYRIVGGNES